MDNVNHPEHYTSGGVECIDAIRASLGDKEFADYCKGNIIKYLWRCQKVSACMTTVRSLTDGSPA